MNELISDEVMAGVRVPLSTRERQRIARSREGALGRAEARQREIDEKYAYASYGPFATQVVDGPQWTRTALRTIGTFGAPYPEDEIALKRRSRYHLVMFMKEEGINPEILRDWMRLHPRLKGPKGRERIQEFEDLLTQTHGRLAGRRSMRSGDYELARREAEFKSKMRRKRFVAHY